MAECIDMPLFDVRLEKESQLLDRMARLGIREADLVERFVKGSGKGGQKVNKTSSCVYLLHKPSGIEIKCQRERSQSLNRFFARRELCDRLEESIQGIHSARRQAIERIRRQKRRRSRRQKERMLGEKRQHSKKKALRGKIESPEA
jgi:peptide chain release factor